VHELLDAGETVAVFPEGTTSNGRDVLKFHASLLEPIVASEGEVWVVAIRYFLGHGKTRTEAAAYIGDMTLLQSLRMIHDHAPIVAELHFIEAIKCAGMNRRDVALRAESAVRNFILSGEPVSGAAVRTAH
jgi:1-acyl-sn-glycerol-3-phosphate acyltransferase